LGKQALCVLEQISTDAARHGRMTKGCVASRSLVNRLTENISAASISAEAEAIAAAIQHAAGPASNDDAVNPGHMGPFTQQTTAKMQGAWTSLYSGHVKRTGGDRTSRDETAARGQRKDERKQQTGPHKDAKEKRRANM
jgi:hypothetical protein